MRQEQIDVTIRRGVPGDLAALQVIFRDASLSNSGDRDVLLGRPDFLIWDGAELAHGHTWVALKVGTIAGFATVVPLADHALELEDLFVAPTRMRQGVARRLIEHVLSTARADGVGSLQVSANPHAAAFYAAVGFQPAGIAQTGFGPVQRLRIDL